ncbi:MAG: hypothetical protein A2745_02055 [Candidatus Harrisonbacteria bacterium RIFCSPHIGHO2_01_FULL_44_13]|uniref:Segregation and condensation protein A n=1 Tax=Candidatus Harrisonbacteria bacterium RIFCSPLOWO2_01_FULL_44_18 TaxID=1798407 RepID=A0A1G1ZMX6_9BACT|nr:MAG: hypothetical protein A2745_02055 [Candidatus Harrisonbacteria bacterium RIFCSPHIGHO2_01_FULL_44_13]OGY66003.1 MAG: hypothetical protein A3A16_01300 [Candidatus Harrisonbacteria bacterium RIFCSPLOWO2_01_FULL_44_18]
MTFMNYEVKLEQFTGPLNKLLELIEARKLEITALNLAEVTEDFINYIRSLEKGADPEILADFIVVASRLILIKSKTLLPSLELTEEEEGEIKDLEARLKIYKEFCSAKSEKDASATTYINKLWNQKQVSFSRELFKNLPPIFYPPRNLNAEDLTNSIIKLTAVLKELLPETRNLKKAIVSVEEKIKELLNRLTQKAQHSFKDLAKEKPRQEIIAVFLAILHLFRDKFINIEQTEPFGDIILKKP